MDWKFSWIWTFICVKLMLISESSSAHLQFAEWAKPCKLPSADPSQFLQPHEECQNSKGLICQTFKEGPLCGCQIGGSLSFDRKSGECRRKVGVTCHAAGSPEEHHSLTFDRRCHADASCAKINGTKTDHKKSSPYMCTCNPGYFAMHDFSACVDPNGASSLKGYFTLASIIIVLLTIFYRYD